MASVEDRRAAVAAGWCATATPTASSGTESFETKGRARAFAETVEVDKRRGDYVDPDGGQVTLRERYEVWLATRVSLRPTTRARDESYANSMILPVLGDRRIGSITHDELQAWVADLVAAGKAPATVVKARQIVSKILAGAVKAKLIPSNPADDLDVPKVEREEQRFLTPAEIARLADCIDPDYRSLVLVGAYCGLRQGELLALRRRHVDLVGRTVTVAENLVEVHGQIHFGQPKTRAGRRTVPMPKPVADALELDCAGLAPDDLIWTAPGGGPLRPSLFRRRIWAPATWAAELAVEPTKENKAKPGERGQDTIGLHALRHSAVALWIAAGANPTEVARRAGHTSVVTVLDRYGHLLPKEEDNVTDALSRLFADGEVKAARSAQVVPIQR